VADHRRRRGGVPARPVDEEQPAVGAEEEAHVDVATWLAAVLAVHWVDLTERVRRAAGGLDCGDEHVPGVGGVRRAAVGRAVVVLDLLDRDQVRRPKVVQDQVRVSSECVSVARVEVLDVVGADDDLLVAR
jgi:hypothetical protein